MPRRTKWIVLILVFFGIVISYIDRGNLSIAAGSLMKDLRLDPSRMGLLLSVFFWTYALFQLPAGYLLDRFGVRLVYAAAFTLWSVASASIALSRGPGDIAASRLVLGFAESVGPLASLTFIRRYFNARQRGFPTGIYIAGQTVGPACGALLGTALLSAYGWRALFAVTGLGALAWVPFWLWFSPRTAAAPEEAATEARALRMNDPAIWALSGCVFFSSYFWWFVMTWMPSYMTMARGFSTLEMGRTLSLPLFTMAVTNLALGWTADRMVAKTGKPIQVRVIFGSAGMLLSSSLLLMNVYSSQRAVLPILFVCICSFGVASSNQWTIAQTLAAGSNVGRFIGYLNMLGQIAAAAAPLITGWSLGPQHDFHVAIWLAGVCPIAATACLLLVGRSSAPRNTRKANPVMKQSKPTAQNAGL